MAEHLTIALELTDAGTIAAVDLSKLAPGPAVVQLAVSLLASLLIEAGAAPAEAEAYAVSAILPILRTIDLMQSGPARFDRG